jgi:hypothetical protein
MAERRMFAKTIIDSDAFLEMPQSTQLLYFHLSMRADDDGFINKPKSIMHMVGCKEDDIKLLIAKKFIIPFETGIVVIKHWKIHNYIRSDRYIETKYKEEKAILELDENSAYRTISECLPHGIPSDNQMDTQDRLGKDRLGEVREGKENTKAVDEIFDHYCETFKGLYTRLTLTDKRKAHIKARLLEGYTVEQAKQAISNIRTSSFHCGENDKNMMYATIEFIFRNTETLEKWINHIPKKSGNANTNMALELYQKALKEEEDAKE